MHGGKFKGVQHFESAGVRTPGLMWRGHLRSGGSVLAFEYIEAAKSLYDEWNNANNDGGRRALLSKVVPMLAALHQHGIVQNDIHPENFLIKDQRLYTIDGGGVRKKNSLSKNSSLENLALFFAQFHTSHDALVPGALNEYCRVRGWVAELSAPDLLELVSEKRAARKTAYISKAFPRMHPLFLQENI